MFYSLLNKIPVATILWFSDDIDFTSGSEDDVSAVIHDRVSFNDLRFTVSFLDLFLNILCSIFHENCWIWITLWHLLLPLNKTTDHSMWYNDWLLRQIAWILSGKHVYLSLIDSKLTDINIQEKHISTLHAWIKQLWDFQLIRFFLSHNGGTFLNSSYRVFASDIHDLHPVLIWSFANLFWSPEELDVGHFHASCFPYLDEILSDCSDLLQVSIELAVQHSEIIGNPEDKDSSSINDFVDINSSEQSLGDVHSAWRFKTIVASEEFFFQQSSLDIFFTYNFLANTLDQLNSFVDGKHRGNWIKELVDVLVTFEIFLILSFFRIGIVKLEATCCPVDSCLHWIFIKIIN